MKIVIAGGAGFLGTALRKFFEKKNYEVKILTRNPKRDGDIYWDAEHLEAWTAALEGIDVLINLTGKSVDCRYTHANKQAILSSRLLSTNALQKAIDQLNQPPKLWINSSSATIYIHASTVSMNEYNGIIGDDFSMNVCKQWEACFFDSKNKDTRKVAIRTSIVLGDDGGAYPKLRTLTKAFLGGQQGDGEQMMSWIHIDDFCLAINHLIEDKEIDGPVNITAPQTISNKIFMQALRKKYNRKWGLDQNRLILELGAIMIGTEAELLLKSRNVYPEKLLLQGFQFKYPSITQALAMLK